MTVWADGIWMPLMAAKLCANCETIHNSASCPVCLSVQYISLSKLLNRATERKPEHELQGEENR